MSSVQSAFSQVGARQRFLVAFADDGVTALVPAGNAAAGGVNTSVNATDFAAVNTAGTTTTVGVVYRDLGRTVTVHDDNSLLAVEVYQKVAVVAGAGTEGNDVAAIAAGDLYVLVWAADAATKVGVARLG